MATATTKKRTLSPEGRKRIAWAQKARWAAKTPEQKTSTVNTEERPEDTIRRLAKRNEELESSFDDQKIAIDDLVGILRREYTYHALRAEELDRLLSLHPETV